MGLLNKLFGRSVSLDQNAKDELVEMCVLKHNELKLNSELLVEDGYMCVIMHLDAMCDILPSGKYKVNDVDTPKLHKFARTIKTKKGVITPKSVIADVYFVNLKKIENNSFKCPYRIVTYQGSDKVKVKIKGSYSIKVDDAKKLMQALLADYDCLGKKAAIKEISAILGYTICDLLNDDKVKLKSLQDKDPELIETLTDKVNKELKSYGVSFDDLNITEVVLPKNYHDITTTIEEVKFQDKPITHADTPKEEPVPVAVAVSHNGEAQANTQDVINLGYGGYTPQQDSYTSPASSQEIYEQYSKRFDVESTNVNHAPQSTPNILGKSVEPTNISGNTNTTDNVASSYQNQTQASTFGAVNILGTNTNNNTEELSVNDYIQRSKQIESIREFVNDTPKDEPIKEINNPVYNSPKPAVEPNKPVLEPKKPSPPQDNYKTCHNCGQRVAPDARFCSNCGSSTADEIRCQACGAYNTRESRFCKICGSKLD